MVSESVARGNLVLILLTAAISFGAWLLNSYKWQLLLRGRGESVSYWELVRLNFVGNFYNLLFPGQLGGEVVKSVRLVRAGVRPSAATVSVVADRITGLLALVLLGLGGALLSPPRTEGLRALIPWAAGFALLLCCASLAVAMRPDLGASQVQRSLFRWRDGVLSGGHNVLLALWCGARRGRKSFWLPLLLSATVQLMVWAMNVVLCAALGVRVAVLDLLWIVAAVSLLQAVPISVAGIGVREGTYVYLLHIQGADSSSALALSLTTFAIQILLAAVGGLEQLREALKTAGKPNASSPDGTGR